MNYEKLKQNLLSNRIEVSNEKLRMLLSFGKEISVQKTEMVVPTLRLEIKRLGNVFYNKDIDNELVTEFVSQIQKKRGKLSLVEISSIFEEIINNETDINKFFSLSEVFRVIDSYISLKARVAKISYELRLEEEKQHQLAQSENEFRLASLQKYKQGFPLTVYEKSVVGKNFEFEIKNADELKELAKKNLPDEIEKLAKRNEVERNGLYVDELVQVPIFWSESLLYGVYLFEAL